MVLYFSGTGNSKFVAQKVADGIGDTLYSINNGIKNNEFPTINEDLVIFVMPIYAWSIPRVVGEWIKNCKAFKGKKAYFLLTCGGDMGNTEKHIHSLCNECEIKFMGCAEIKMPDNYIIMFPSPTENEINEKMASAENITNKIIEEITCGKALKSKKVTLLDKLKSSIVNVSFNNFYIGSKKYFTTGACISCGKCEALCPANCITMQNGKPIWNNNCTQCMACISYCPTHAIEYGKSTQNKVRYTCPK